VSQSRRRFMRIAGAGTVASAFSLDIDARAAVPPRFRAIAFDAFPILDPRPIAAIAEKLFPGRGPALMDTWRTRQFEYSWLRSVSHRYVDFWRVTEDALVFAASVLELPLDASARQRLMEAYLDLRAWPDVVPALTALHEAGVRLAFLSNFTRAMLEAPMKNSGIEQLFTHVLSTDMVQSFKPDPRAYALALDAFELPREEILFAPFAGWDAAGARWFGYPTFWVNRLHAVPEQLGVSVDGSGADLAALVNFVLPSGGR
jgi:2-haloacid dehalogenase